MSDWLDRLKKERDDLAEKTEKLHRFLAEVEGDEAKRLRFDGWQLQLMLLQFDHMQSYLQILNLRIKHADETS